jgi:hypothetical protein
MNLIIPRVCDNLINLALVMQAWWVPKMWLLDPYVTPKRFDSHTYTNGRGR